MRNWKHTTERRQEEEERRKHDRKRSQTKRKQWRWKYVRVILHEDTCRQNSTNKYATLLSPFLPFHFILFSSAVPPYLSFIHFLYCSLLTHSSLYTLPFLLYLAIYLHFHPSAKMTMRASSYSILVSLVFPLHLQAFSIFHHFPSNSNLASSSFSLSHLFLPILSLPDLPVSSELRGWKDITLLPSTLHCHSQPQKLFQLE